MNLDVGEWDDNGAASSSFKWTADAKVAPAAPAPAPVEEKPQDEDAKGAGKRKELDPEVVARKKAKRKQQAARQKAKAKEVKAKAKEAAEADAAADPEEAERLRREHKRQKQREKRMRQRGVEPDVDAKERLAAKAAKRARVEPAKGKPAKDKAAAGAPRAAAKGAAPSVSEKRSNSAADNGVAGKAAAKGKAGKGKAGKDKTGGDDDGQRAKVEAAAAAAARARAKLEREAAEAKRAAGKGKGKLTALQAKMKAKLTEGNFRWLNERLYTTESRSAVDLFGKDPELFDTYHDGFRSQVEKWPVNPLDLIVRHVCKTRKKDAVVADLGCGEGKLALRVPCTVHSFDLVSRAEHIVACDVANVPLDAASVDVAVFSLALMGTNYVDFLREARRILRPSGELVIAEVESRIPNVDQFIDLVSSIGFQLAKEHGPNKFFSMWSFKVDKPAEDDQLLAIAGDILQPCIYKRR